MGNIIIFGVLSDLWDKTTEYIVGAITGNTSQVVVSLGNT